MTRITLWFVSTLTAVVLLFGYHTSTSATLAATPPGSVVAGSTGGGSTSGTTGSSGTTGARSTGSSTVTGGVASTMWGPVQVQLTVASGKITGVQVLQYPSGNGHDQQINAYALPILVQETVKAQSASIDMVSGATVTSMGYLQSLQSALDQARL
jgi:uncharacterized protein with FMN-binding domain